MVSGSSELFSRPPTATKPSLFRKAESFKSLDFEEVTCRSEGLKFQERSLDFVQFLLS